jgi:hypothetical protein
MDTIAQSIIDYKTSSRVKDTSQSGDYWLQAAFYAIAHNEMFDTKIENGEQYNKSQQRFNHFKIAFLNSSARRL